MDRQDIIELGNLYNTNIPDDMLKNHRVRFNCDKITVDIYDFQGNEVDELLNLIKDWNKTRLTNKEKKIKDRIKILESKLNKGL